MTIYRIKLPYATPPLHANRRFGNRHQKARITGEVRRAACWLSRSAKIGAHPRVIVGLEWRPKTRRTRDGGENLAPLLKALIDGAITDAGVCPDDDPEHVERRMPVLLPVGEGDPGMWLVVETP